MTRIILELEGDQVQVEEKLKDLLNCDTVSIIAVRTKENVEASRSLVQDWCDASKELNDFLNRP